MDVDRLARARPQAAARARRAARRCADTTAPAAAGWNARPRSARCRLRCPASASASVRGSSNIVASSGTTVSRFSRREQGSARSHQPSPGTPPSATSACGAGPVVCHAASSHCSRPAAPAGAHAGRARAASRARRTVRGLRLPGCRDRARGDREPRGERS